jgi:hypothetical protein
MGKWAGEDSEGHLRPGERALSGPARGDGAGRRFTNHNAIDGALIRHPPEVVLLAHRVAGPERHGAPAGRVPCRLADREVLLSAGHPFYSSRGGHDRIRVLLSEDTDWDEIRELVTESYRLLAPKKLSALLDC